MSIPKDKKWSGMFPGNYAGNLWQTFNMDLERSPGRIVLSDKLKRIATSGLVTKFLRTNADVTDRWWALVPSVGLFKNNNSSITETTWTADAIASTPTTTVLDMVTHENVNGEQRLLVTKSNGDIAILNRTGSANAWTTDWWDNTLAQTLMSTAVGHPIARLQRLVAVGDKSSVDVPCIHTINKDDVVSLNRLVFDTDYSVQNIYTSSNRYWIGLKHDRGGKAKIIEWDGSSLTYNNEYELTGSNPITGFIVDDIPYFITDAGIIFRYSGGGFYEFQRFIAPELRLPLSAANIGNAISNYGCYVDGHIIYINLAAPTLQSFSATSTYRGARRLRSGVWILNIDNKNLYHHMGIGEHASSGTDINYGTSPFSGAGALTKATDSSDMITSAAIYTGGTLMTTQTSGIYIQEKSINQASNAGRNRGYFITPYIPISEAEGLWEALVVKFKRFVNSNNRIVVKFRVLDPLYNSSAADQNGNAFEDGGINAPITWVNTTSFTCKVPTGVSVGNEVEVLVGDNAGCSFAILAISSTPDNTTLLTVTIAEAAPTSSIDTAMVRFDNWKTETVISSTTVGNMRVPFQSNTQGEFIQFKIEMRGFDVQIDELIPVMKTKTSIKQS